MSKEKNKHPQGNPPSKEKSSPKPLANGNFGESKADQDSLRKAAEIPPKRPKPNKNDK